jgi:HEAT repeat protein
LEVWLRTYAPRSPYQLGSPQWKETDEAVRQIGTNGIPTLVRMIRARDSKLKLTLVALAQKLAQKQHVIKVGFVPAADRNIEASRAFVALGDAGHDAVPLLMEAFGKDITSQSRYAIADALGWIGPSARAAVPLLLQAATNSDTRLRANALWALGDIHAQPEVCVPVLIHALGDFNGQARLSAVHALGRFGADARPAIEPLTELAKPRAELSKASAGRSATVMSDWISEVFEARRALERIGAGSEGVPDLGVPPAESVSEPRELNR